MGSMCPIVGKKEKKRDKEKERGHLHRVGEQEREGGGRLLPHF